MILQAAMGMQDAFAGQPNESEGRMFAAVLLIRGSVSGGNIGSYGVYVRDEGDTTWKKITRSNVISFGLGYFERGQTHRYYLAGGNGLHRSTDEGKTWRVLTTWTTEEILGVVPDPVDSALIYVATPFGVFKTTDDGTSWHRKMTGFNKWFIQRLIMDPRDRRTLYAASEDGIYKTIDGGDHWRTLYASKTQALALFQHPAMPDYFVAGFEDGGVLYSSNSGATWQPASGMINSTVYTFSSSADGNDLYTAGWKTGLWRSNDRGVTWSRVWADSSIEAIYSIFVDPRNAQHLMVGSVGNGVYESHDRGATWKYAGLAGGQIKQIELYK